MQESGSVLLTDVKALKNPCGHTSHLGWELAVPAALVYLPGGHLVCATQESVSMFLLDVKSLKNPDAHVLQ